MKNLNIITKLGVTPDTECCCNKYLAIKRGSTAEITLFLKDYPFIDLSRDGDNILCNIDQLTILFKLAVNNIGAIYMFDPETGELDPHFTLDVDAGCIYCFLSSEETSQLPLADADHAIQVEAAFKMDTDKLISQQQDSIIIENLTPIVVIDTLYNQFIQ